MEQSRLFRIVYHLLEKRKSTAPELAEKLEVSIRTIYQDLDAISAAGIPVYAAQGKGGGIFIMQDFVLDKSLLSEQEKEQILMALQGIFATENNQSDELLIKLGGFFQSKVTNWIEVDFSEWYKNTPKSDVFNRIKSAIFNRYMICFSYFAREGNYSNRVSALYSLAYAVEMVYKAAAIQNEFHDFTVYPLEGIWRKTEETELVKENLEYTIMRQQPDFICEDIVKVALEQIKIKKPNPLFDEVRFGTMQDGKCVEMLYIGAFDDEPVSFAKMEQFV